MSVEKKVSLSREIEFSSQGEAVKEAIEALEEAVSKIDPEARIVVQAVTKKEKFNKVNMAIVNLLAVPRIYNERTFMANPSIATEFAEMAEAIKTINKLVAKRKKEWAARFKKKTNKPSEEEKPEENTAEE